MSPQSGGHYDVTYCTTGAADGKLRWARFHGKGYFTQTGEVYRFAGVAQEITDQVLARQKVDESESYFRKLVMQVPIGICVLKATDLVSEIVNDSFLEVAGKPYEAIIGKNYWTPFAEAEPYYGVALQNVVDAGKAFFANEAALMLIRHGKEETIYVTVVYEPLKDDQGQVRKVVIWVLENTY